MQNDAPLLIATVVLAVAVLALLVWLGQRGKSRPADNAPPAPVLSSSAPPPPTASSGGLGPVHAAIAAGRKIEAIKLYRDLTGVGLKEAKEAVDALERGELVTFTPLQAPTPAAGGMEEITRLARSGQLIAAIKLHRELTGLGLKESKDAVEKLRDGR